MTLEGKKTYIAVALISLANFAEAMGWIERRTTQIIINFLLASGLIFLRMGIAANTKKM